MPQDNPIALTHDLGGGLYADKFDDGSVRLVRTGGPHPSEGGGTAAKVRLTPEQWADVVKAMAAKPPAKPDVGSGK